jgi:hypothetical protein
MSTFFPVSYSKKNLSFAGMFLHTHVSFYASSHFHDSVKVGFFQKTTGEFLHGLLIRLDFARMLVSGTALCPCITLNFLVDQHGEVWW